MTRAVGPKLPQPTPLLTCCQPVLINCNASRLAGSASTILSAKVFGHVGLSVWPSRPYRPGRRPIFLLNRELIASCAFSFIFNPIFFQMVRQFSSPLNL
ncbi:hypothetical protein BpHYR1_017522 [Brachionus plicatilis]|uniref:Uncharacterized protein n=1 Tax=Brachionus plicatilis TaxID=10195 RepID=A0A3M7QZZ3_BRAPC|nr:hypothetical protein BpHYR1_017522 [Brachionus plicatilis]